MLAQATRVNTRILRQRSAGPYDDTYISRFIQISHLHFLLYASTPHEEGAPPTLLLPSVKYSKLIKLVTELQMLVQLMDYSNSANLRSSFVDGSSSMTNSNSSKEKKKAGKKTKDAVKLSTEPQSMAARERRHRISARFKILQSMVPDGTKMDTV